MKKCRLILTYILMGGTMAFSQPGAERSFSGAMHGMPSGGPLMKMRNTIENPAPMMRDITELQNMMNEINIDKAVSVKIVTIARAFLKSMDERILKIQKEELSIKEELLKAKPDLQAIQNAIARKTQILGDIEFAQIKRDLEIKSLLTADEYDRWKSAMMQKMVMPMFMDKMNQNQNQPGKPPAAN
jgi:superfamily II RNA helicase